MLEDGGVFFDILNYEDMTGSEIKTLVLETASRIPVDQRPVEVVP